MKYILSILLIIVIFAISITVGAANDQTVTFNYLLAQADVRLSTLLAILFGSGFLVGWLLTGIFFLKLKLKHTATKRRLKKIQKQYDDKLANHQKTQLTTTH